MRRYALPGREGDFLAANQAEAAFHARIADTAELGLLRHVFGERR